MTVYLEMSFVYMQTSGWTYENEDSFYSYAYFSFAFVDHFSFRLRNAFRKKKTDLWNVDDSDPNSEFGRTTEVGDDSRFVMYLFERPFESKIMRS